MQLVVDPLSSKPHPLLGAVLRGTYEIKRVLDRGGMGIVFEAEQIRLHRRVAIKVLPAHLAQERQALLRFQREAELVSLLHHPHVVQIVDFDTTERGEPYIVMEFLAGESLELRLTRQPVLPVEFAVRVATQVASGLAAVHEARIVHRDLKPANIFLSEISTHGLHVKLLDFGIGKLIGGPRLTGENDVLGTPDYMPPEQALGKTAHVDQRGDQYSLAVIVYEMLAGRGPFSGDMMEILEQVISREAPLIEDLARGLPPGIGPVLRRAMAKEPTQRFDTIAEFASALSAALSAPKPTLLLPTREPSLLRALQSDASALLTERRESPTIAPPRQAARNNSSSPAEARPSQGLLLQTLAAAKRARSARDIDLAASLVERALAVAEALGDRDAEAALEREEALIEGALEIRLGPRGFALRVGPPRKDDRLSLLPEEAFLLSCIDGHVSAEEMLDLSPLPRVRTLRLLVRLLRRGLFTTQAGSLSNI